MNRYGKIVVRIHQAMGGRHDAVTIGVGVIAYGNLEPILEPHESRHGIRT
jgi:hypothetical protein